MDSRLNGYFLVKLILSLLQHSVLYYSSCLFQNQQVDNIQSTNDPRWYSFDHDQPSVWEAAYNQTDKDYIGAQTTSSDETSCVEGFRPILACNPDSLTITPGESLFIAPNSTIAHSDLARSKTFHHSGDIS